MTKRSERKGAPEREQQAQQAEAPTATDATPKESQQASEATQEPEKQTTEPSEEKAPTVTEETQSVSDTEEPNKVEPEATVEPEKQTVMMLLKKDVWDENGVRQKKGTTVPFSRGIARTLSKGGKAEAFNPLLHGDD